MKSFNLPGGIYELKGFPLRTGFNVVKIVKTSFYDVIPPSKNVLVSDGEYNDINETYKFNLHYQQKVAHVYFDILFEFMEHKTKLS